MHDTLVVLLFFVAEAASFVLAFSGGWKFLHSARYLFEMSMCVQNGRNFSVLSWFFLFTDILASTACMGGVLRNI